MVGSASNSSNSSTGGSPSSSTSTGSGGGFGGSFSGGGFGAPGGGGNSGGNGSSSSGTGTNGGQGAGAGKSAAGSASKSSSSDNKSSFGGMNVSLSRGQTDTGNTQTTGGVMSGLKASVDAARADRTGAAGGQSATSRGIADAVGRTMGTAAAAGNPNSDTKAPNATPAQKDAYRSGYRDEANSGMTQSAFGMVPGVGSLVGKAVGASITQGDRGMAPENAAAYSSGQKGASAAGIGSVAQGAGTALGALIGGPIGAALAKMAMGSMSYAMQREANPEAFSGAGKTYSGPVTGSGTFSGDGNNGGTSVPSPTMTNALAAPAFESASDYSDQYNSYQNMNLGRFTR